MPRINKDENNIVTVPFNVSVAKNGYVYLNTSTTWVNKTHGQGKRADHTKECIGRLVVIQSDWKQDRRMYANSTFHRLFPDLNREEKPASPRKAEALSEYPDRSDNMAIGLYAVVKQVAEHIGLTEILAGVFGGSSVALILDLAMYMLSAESATFQHFPHWARNHALFSNTVRSDGFISEFEKNELSLSRINLFRKRWAAKALDDGLVFVCYDSTNVNSVAEGIFIVEKGHAKDDPDKEQVNTEYAIRQRDGMPITFKSYPGSINDISEASEMIEFFRMLLGSPSGSDEPPTTGENGQPFQLCVIADRGYVSEENITLFRQAGIGYLLMLKKNMGMVGDILDEFVPEIKKPGNYLPDSGRFAMTIQRKLFADDCDDSWFHIVWDAGLEVSHRRELTKDIEAKERKLQRAAKRNTRLTDDELRTYEKYFVIDRHQEGTLEVSQRGRATGKTKKVPSYVVDSYTRDEAAIEREHNHCGYVIYVSSRAMSANDAIEALSKRDCVEKVFRALKSWLGMDKISVHFESSVHAKSLIWFISSVIRSVIFTRTEKLRTRERKQFTVPALLRLFEAITADKDLESGEYKRRYKLTKRQRLAIKCFNIDEANIDAYISEL